MYRVRIYRDGVHLVCTDVYGFPVQMKFASLQEPVQPYLFETVNEAKETWRLYQKHKPADTMDWFMEIDEL